MSGIERYKKYANTGGNAPSWGVLVTFSFGGEERYGFWRDIPSNEGMGSASFPPTETETLEIARYEAGKHGKLPKEYTIAVSFYNPDRAFVRKSVFTSAQTRRE